MSIDPEVDNIEQFDKNDYPRYCDYNKFLLVEEIVLEDDLLRLHYGKCCVIGKVRCDEQGIFQLENIKLPNTPSKYSLPEGTLSVNLLHKTYLGSALKNARFCEVIGEVVLIKKEISQHTLTPITSRGLHEKVALCSEKDKKDFIDNIKIHYKPAIRVWDIREIDRAGELSELNLCIRMIKEQT